MNLSNILLIRGVSFYKIFYAKVFKSILALASLPIVNRHSE